jgi:DNA-directed RNA polymerase specialized sigma24 family protein
MGQLRLIPPGSEGTDWPNAGSYPIEGGWVPGVRRALLRSAVRGLNVGEQDLIELQLRQELDVAEIASVLGVPRAAGDAARERAR